jgi:DNA-directed RNA polymerase subunit RPC12/RpoP
MDNSKFIKQHKCPACGGTLVFSPEKGKLVCEFCDTEYEVEKDEGAQSPAEKPQTNVSGEAQPDAPQIEGFDFSQFYESAKVPNGENLPIYLCKSCGAEVIASSVEASLTCPYCTNKIVLTDKLSGSIRPDGIIPFKIPQKDLKAHLDNFYKDKKLLPKNFFSESKMEKVTGIYVPFWLFTGKLSGDYSYAAHKISTTESNDYKITTTRYYHTERRAEAGFADIPIDASDKMKDSLMDSVLPYDMSEVKPFSTDYLAGYAADRFDVPGKAMQSRADKLMSNTLQRMVEGNLHAEYTNISRNRSSIHAEGVKVRYILMPVYAFNIKWGNKKYGFGVNGQTGKVVGDLPTDKNVSRFYFLVRFGALAGGIFAALFISYLFGGAL